MSSRGSKAKAVDLSRLVADLKSGNSESRARAAKHVVAAAAADAGDGDDSGAARLVRAGAVAPLAALVSAGTDLGQIHAATALATLAAAGFTNELAQVGTIKQTINMMRTSSQQAQAAAVALLKFLSAPTAHRSAILAAGAVSPLVRLLKQGSIEARVQAALAMAHLAHGRAEAQASMATAGAVPLLIALLPSGKAQMAAASALAALCSAAEEPPPPDAEAEEGAATESAENDLSSSTGGGEVPAEIQMAVLREGGVPPLLALLDGVNVHAQIEAAKAIARLACGNPATQNAIYKAGGIGPLLALLPGRSVGAQARGAEALAMLAGHNPENQEAIYRLGGVGPLVALLSPSNEPDVQAMAAMAIMHVSRGMEQIQSSVAECGGIAQCVVLLRYDASMAEPKRARAAATVKAEAAGAVWVLADGHPANKSAVASAGGLTPLVQLLSNGGLRAREHATNALASLSLQAADNQRQIAALLVAQLGSGSMTAKSRAAVALWRIVQENPSSHATIASAGSAGDLIALLKDGANDARAFALWSLSLSITPDNQSVILDQVHMPSSPHMHSPPKCHPWLLAHSCARFSCGLVHALSFAARGAPSRPLPRFGGDARARAGGHGTCTPRQLQHRRANSNCRRRWHRTAH